MRREINQRKQGENDDDDGDVPAAAAAAEEKGVRGASPARPLFFFFSASAERGRV